MSAASFLAVWMSACRELSTCRLTRGSKKTSVKATDLPQAAAAVEEIHARRGEDALVEIRAAAVVSDIIAADVQLRNPEDLGPRELCFGDPDAGLGGGHDQRPGVGEPQGGGEVDRKAEVGRLQRRGLELHERFALPRLQGQRRRRARFAWRLHAPRRRHGGPQQRGRRRRPFARQSNRARQRGLGHRRNRHGRFPGRSNRARRRQAGQGLRLFRPAIGPAVLSPALSETGPSTARPKPTRAASPSGGSIPKPIVASHPPLPTRMPRCDD